MKQFHSRFEKTEFGMIKIMCDSSNLLSLNIVNEIDEPFKHNVQTCKLCQLVICQLKEYFAGIRKQFDLPIELNGSELQVSVWNYLHMIPYGTTVSYSKVANAVNCKSVRAVATIIGQNPIPIIIPCHRVIRKDGTIGEFSLFGPEFKKILLDIEKANI